MPNSRLAALRAKALAWIADVTHGELRETAATRAEVLRQVAATKSGELRSSAVTRGAEPGPTATQRASEVRRHIRNIDVPWARCRPARLARETILQFGLRPLLGLYTRLHVQARDRFDDIPPPVVFVANHSSHMDTPII